MAKYELESPWQNVGGKLSKKNTKVVWARKKHGTRFTQVRGKRSTPVSSSETAIRQRFTICVRAANARAQDMTVATKEQMAYIQERNAKGANFKYVSFIGWLRGKAFKNFNEETQQVVWPEV